ncbi:hypothetical protein BDV10DRAFT_165928 [Aspergillus recurvatus]
MTRPGTGACRSCKIRLEIWTGMGRLIVFNTNSGVYKSDMAVPPNLQSQPLMLQLCCLVEIVRGQL